MVRLLYVHLQLKYTGIYWVAGYQLWPSTTLHSGLSVSIIKYAVHEGVIRAEPEQTEGRICLRDSIVEWGQIFEWQANK